MEYIKQYNTNEVYVNEKLTEKIDKINSHPLTVVEAPIWPKDIRAKYRWDMVRQQR